MVTALATAASDAKESAREMPIVFAIRFATNGVGPEKLCRWIGGAELSGLLQIGQEYMRPNPRFINKFVG